MILVSNLDCLNRLIRVTVGGPNCPLVTSEGSLAVDTRVGMAEEARALLLDSGNQKNHFVSSEAPLIYSS